MDNKNNRQNVRKERFIYLYKIKWNNKAYRVFWNSNLGYYPIEIINGKPYFPEYDSYIEIFKYYKEKNESKSHIFYLKDEWKSSILFNPKNNNNNNKKILTIKPFVRYIGAGLISVWLALSMGGCTIPIENSKIEQNMSEEQDTSEEYTEPKEEYLDQPEELSEELINHIIEKLHEKQYEVEYNYKLKRFILKEGYDSFYDKKVIYINNQSELREYFTEENQNPTFKDIHNEIDNNPNIPQDIKEKYHIIVDRLEKNCPGIDLFALNMNVKTLTVTVENNRYNPKKLYTEELAYCVPGNSITYKCYNLPIEHLAHEFIGHNLYQTEKHIDGDTVILYRPDFYEMIYIPETKEIKMVYRDELTEGLANLFAKECSDSHSLNSDDFYFYIPTTEGANTLLQLSNTSLEEYVEIGNIGFLEKLVDFGITNPVESIGNLNNLYGIYYYTPSGETPSYSLKEWIEDTAEEVLNHQRTEDDKIGICCSSAYSNSTTAIKFVPNKIAEEYDYNFIITEIMQMENRTVMQEEENEQAVK